MIREIPEKKLYLAAMVFAASLLALSTTCMGDDGHKPITEELINLVEENPEIGSMLEASIAKAKEINPDPMTNPVQSLLEYYDFIDRT